jgi:hypothetical protein
MKKARVKNLVKPHVGVHLGDKMLALPPADPCRDVSHVQAPKPSRTEVP